MSERRSSVHPRASIRIALLACVGLAVSSAALTPALAAFHLAAIQEVFVGAPGDASAPLTADQRSQYVMLRMWSSGQTFLDNTFIRVEDPAGNILGRFGTFTSPDGVTNGGTGGCDISTCPSMLIGTQNAKNLFTFSFDKLTTGQASRIALNPAGGRVCFQSGTSTVDCLAWGSFNCSAANCPGGPNTLHAGDFTANGCDPDFGTPAPALRFGFTLARISFDCGLNENASDFVEAFPFAMNNLGANDNVDSDGDGLINQLDCDDTTGTILWPPPEVGKVVITKPSPGLAVLAWGDLAPASGSAVVYDVVRGTLANLNGFTDAACYAADLLTPTTNDATPPGIGPGGFYYLVRARASAPCTGLYGPGPAYTVLNPLCP